MLSSDLKENISLRGKAAEWRAKFWMFVASLIIVINLFIILTLLQMTPQLRMWAQILINPMTTQQLVQTSPFSQTFGDKKLIDETLVRHYLDMRYNQISDKWEMERRWGPRGPVATLSSPDVYKKFAGQNLNERLEKISSSSPTKNVDVLSVSRLDNTFTIEFDLYTYFRGSLKSTRHVAIITIGYNSGRKHYRSTGANPYGLYVRTFNESVKKD